MREKRSSDCGLVCLLISTIATNRTSCGKNIWLIMWLHRWDNRMFSILEIIALWVGIYVAVSLSEAAGWIFKPLPPWRLSRTAWPKRIRDEIFEHVQTHCSIVFRPFACRKSRIRIEVIQVVRANTCLKWFRRALLVPVVMLCWGCNIFPLNATDSCYHSSSGYDMANRCRNEKCYTEVVNYTVSWADS